MLAQAAAPLLAVAGMVNTQPSAGHRHVKQGSFGQRQAAMQVSCAAPHTTAVGPKCSCRLPWNVPVTIMHQGRSEGM